MNIEQWSHKRETSEEIAIAIFEVAEDQKENSKSTATIEEIADYIWQEGLHANKIISIAFKNTDNDELYWGEETVLRSEAK
jgi:hypothetical protein